MSSEVFPTVLAVLTDDSKSSGEHHDALITIRNSLTGAEVLTELLALQPFESLRKFLRMTGPENHCLTFESCRIVSTIASSTAAHCGAIIAADLHTDLGRLLSHPHITTAEQAALALGSIAFNSSRLRNVILEGNDLVASLCRNFNRKDSTNTFRENVAGTLSILCQGKPRPDRQFTEPMLPLFKEILISASKDKIVRVANKKWIFDVLWAIAYLSNSDDGDSENIQMCLNYGLVPLVLKLFRNKFVSPPGLADTPVITRRMPCEQLGEVLEYLPRTDLVRLATISRDVFETTICDNATLFNRLRQGFALSIADLRIPALRFFGNVVTGTDRQTDVAIRKGVLELLEALIQLGGIKKGELRDLLWSLSNIVAGTEGQIRAVLGRPTLVKTISDALISDERPVAKEAMWVVSQIHEGVPSQLFSHVEKIVIPALVVRFTCNPNSPDYGVLNVFFDSYDTGVDNEVWGTTIPYNKEPDVVKLRDSIGHLIGAAKRHRGMKSELVAALSKLFQLFLADCQTARHVASPDQIMSVLFFRFNDPSQAIENGNDDDHLQLTNGEVDDEAMADETWTEGDESEEDEDEEMNG